MICDRCGKEHDFTDDVGAFGATPIACTNMAQDERYEHVCEDCWNDLGCTTCER